MEALRSWVEHWSLQYHGGGNIQFESNDKSFILSENLVYIT